jgi:hypothetical protein
MPDVATDVKLSFLHWLMTEDATRQENIRQYREYYDGEHDTQLTERQRSYLELKVGQEFNGNYCPIPIDSLAEKLTVTGVSAGDAQTPVIWDWLVKNKIDGLQGIVHTAALRDGDSYIMVSWDDDRQMPVFTVEPACCDGEGCQSALCRRPPRPRGLCHQALARQGWRGRRLQAPAEYLLPRPH